TGIRAGARGRGTRERYTLDDLEAVQPDARLLRVVRHDARAAHAKVHEDLHADPVFAVIRLESQALVRLDRVEALVLELVRAQVVHQSDAAAFLAQVHEHAAALVGYPLDYRVELVAAVAALR